MSLQSIKKILAHEQLAPLKKLGQNFLIHRQTAARIVELARISPGDTVVEVGVGLGVMMIMVSIYWDMASAGRLDEGL